ncbi:hypothetical protein DFH06DRAFT_1140718 [Mycena polygramma]|nr:hypothetical protein DFH06DRAFT_1140718 [Mycena polygramma]
MYVGIAPDTVHLSTSGKKVLLVVSKSEIRMLRVDFSIDFVFVRVARTRNTSIFFQGLLHLVEYEGCATENSRCSLNDPKLVCHWKILDNIHLDATQWTLDFTSQANNIIADARDQPLETKILGKSQDLSKYRPEELNTCSTLINANKKNSKDSASSVTSIKGQPSRTSSYGGAGSGTNTVDDRVRRPILAWLNSFNGPPEWLFDCDRRLLSRATAFSGRCPDTSTWEITTFGRHVSPSNYDRTDYDPKSLSVFLRVKKLSVVVCVTADCPIAISKNTSKNVKSSVAQMPLSGWPQTVDGQGCRGSGQRIVNWEIWGVQGGRKDKCEVEAGPWVPTNLCQNEGRDLCQNKSQEKR